MNPSGVSEVFVVNRIALWIGLAGVSWLALQAVHELGHVLGAWATGGVVTEADLHPMRVSHTSVDPNPQPALEVWAGPVFGAVAPVFLWLVVRRVWPTKAAYFRFFAGFCLIANGAYLGSAALEPVGDAFDLLHHGAHLWQLVVFGLLTVPWGVWLWDGLSAQLGMKPNAPAPPARDAWGILALFMVVAAFEAMLF